MTYQILYLPILGYYLRLSSWCNQKQVFATPIFNYILPLLYKTEIKSIIYHKYGKSIIMKFFILTLICVGGNSPPPPPTPPPPPHPPPVGFPLITEKLYACHFAALGNISLRTFVPNLVSLTFPQSTDIAQKSDGDICDFRISGQSLINKNYHNFRTSNDIAMKLGPATKLDNRNTATSKQFWRWRHVNKLCCHCYFYNSWTIWSNLEPGFQTGDL